VAGEGGSEEGGGLPAGQGGTLLAQTTNANPAQGQRRLPSRTERSRAGSVSTPWGLILRLSPRLTGRSRAGSAFDPLGSCGWAVYTLRGSARSAFDPLRELRGLLGTLSAVGRMTPSIQGPSNPEGSKWRSGRKQGRRRPPRGAGGTLLAPMQHLDPLGSCGGCCVH